MGIAWLNLLCPDVFLISGTSQNTEKCLLNPTIKRRRRLRPLADLLRRQSNRKTQERPPPERKRKCKLREQLKGKRRKAKVLANRNLAKCIHVTTLGPPFEDKNG